MREREREENLYYEYGGWWWERGRLRERERERERGRERKRDREKERNESSPIYTNLINKLMCTYCMYLPRHLEAEPFLVGIISIKLQDPLLH